MSAGGCSPQKRTGLFVQARSGENMASVTGRREDVDGVMVVVRVRSAIGSRGIQTGLRWLAKR